MVALGLEGASLEDNAPWPAVLGAHPRPPPAVGDAPRLSPEAPFMAVQPLGWHPRLADAHVEELGARPAVLGVHQISSRGGKLRGFTQNPGPLPMHLYMYAYSRP